VSMGEYARTSEPVRLSTSTPDLDGIARGLMKHH